MTSRHQRDSFEAFYKGVRDDLLLQTYALTGDLSASEKAVRDALVVAWHHWRKVSQLDDPEAWIRPLAWSRAQRRHTARWWHRQRDIPSDVRATLDALGSLSTTQRRALLLTVLTAQPLQEIAREVGLSQSALERELQLASSQFALARDVDSTRIRPLLQAMRPEIASARWPRATILLRAGTARRRSHATVGIVAALAATVVAGSVVTDANGVSPDLASKGISTPTPRERPQAPVAVEPELDGEALLDASELAAVAPGQWTVGTTSRNTEGNGINMTCQLARYSDPEGVGTLVRRSSAPPDSPQAPDEPDQQSAGASPAAERTVVQAVEVSRTSDAATAAYDLARSWFAGCTTERVQLLQTYDVTGVGDAASLVALRSWSDPASTLLVGVARTGEITTTLSSSVPGTRAPDIDGAASMLGAAVTGLCPLPGAGACVTTPQWSEVRPAPIEAAPAMIGEIDLPPVGRVSAPWAGADPSAPTTNDAATRCDNADFSQPGFSHAQTRSFLIPAATQLPPEFGLTETVGALPPDRAQQFVERVRERLATCAERDLGTEVTLLDDVDSQRRALSIWRVSVEIDEDRTVDYRMAILRSGTSIAQLGFIAAPDVDMTDESFRALVARALQRLDALPDPA